jgi:hypothetical protein
MACRFGQWQREYCERVVAAFLKGEKPSYYMLGPGDSLGRLTSAKALVKAGLVTLEADGGKSGKGRRHVPTPELVEAYLTHRFAEAAGDTSWDWMDEAIRKVRARNG